MKRYFEDKTEISTTEELHIAICEIGYMVDEAIHDEYSKKVCQLVDNYTMKLGNWQTVESWEDR